MNTTSVLKMQRELVDVTEERDRPHKEIVRLSSNLNKLDIEHKWAVGEAKRLTEENERLRENAKIIYELEQLAARSNNDLLVENARLRKDAERIDWLSHQDFDALCLSLVIDAPHCGEYYVCGDNNDEGYGRTFREAIDAARGAK